MCLIGQRGPELSRLYLVAKKWRVKFARVKGQGKSFGENRQTGSPRMREEKKAASHKGYLSLSKGRLFFESAGTGIPFFFVHGGLADRRMWDGQFAFFSRHFRVIRYDGRGFGRSDTPSAPFYPHQDLKALFESLAVKRAVIMGQSMGGGISIDFALEYPEMVERLILVGPSLPGFSYSPDFLKKGLELFSVARGRGPEEALRELFEDPYWSYTLPPIEKSTLREKMGEMAAHFFRVFQWDPSLMRTSEPSAVQRLSEIVVPTLVVTAEKEHAENRRVIGKLLRDVKGAHMAIIPGAGHMMNMEEPERFNRIVEDFLFKLKEQPVG